jgi:hypothetical protein
MTVQVETKKSFVEQFFEGLFLEGIRFHKPAPEVKLHGVIFEGADAGPDAGSHGVIQDPWLPIDTELGGLIRKDCKQRAAKHLVE